MLMGLNFRIQFRWDLFLDIGRGSPVPKATHVGSGDVTSDDIRGAESSQGFVNRLPPVFLCSKLGVVTEVICQGKE